MSFRSNIANILTLIRIACIPLMVFVFFSNIENARPLSAIIFIAAALTDWLDGWVAREFDQTSKLGAFLDPVADKLIVCIALLMIVQSDPTLINTLVSIVIIWKRDFYFCTQRVDGRTWRKTSGISHCFFKIKDNITNGWSCMHAISIPLIGIDVYLFGMISLIIASILTVWTMVIYMAKAWPFLQGGID
ncbi:MAG: CDP-diacylglycerol--glycerol-3-phosphate 3-phosphatidyltransferase [Pseudomonadota bacterium]|nr:MAG: CDP-diacylglycerol--glycerol-3-phosphate 3-phosphatidyltransferase [Pseudomonadota bacterium]